MVDHECLDPPFNLLSNAGGPKGGAAQEDTAGRRRQNDISLNPRAEERSKLAEPGRASLS